MIDYVFRKPIYPVIYKFNGRLIGGRNEKDFERNLLKQAIITDDPHDVIDSRGEVWLISTKKMLMSPISFKKKFSKKRLIETYNQSENCKENNSPYSDKSLSNKKFAKILEDLLQLM